MKKILFAVAAAGMMFATSCNDSFKSSDENSGLADSLAVTSAQAMGVQLRNQQLPLMKEQFGDDFNQASFEKGLKAGATLDTADVSYILGLQMGMNLSGQAYQMAKEGMKVDQAKMVKALINAINDTTLNMEQIYMQMNQLQARLQQIKNEKVEKELNAKVEANKAAAEKYVADLKKKDADVKTTASGLSYKIENAGDNTRANADDVVSVIYTGKHLNGEEFDSSKGQPVEFVLSQVVPGFSEGLQLIGKGGKATLYIPGDLAYGVHGQPMANIEPNEMLVFEVELTNVTPAE